MVGWKFSRWMESRNKEAQQWETFKERSPRDGWMEMWFFEEDVEMGELICGSFCLGGVCDLWTLFSRKRKDQKKFVEVCYEQKKGGDPSTSKLNLDYLALLMAENLYRNMYSLFIP